MKLRILGTGTAAPSLERASSSYLLSTRTGNVLIDAGPSVVRRLLEFGYGLNDIDVIALTHFHPDHTVDLVTFLFACNYGERRREKDLILIGGRGIRSFFRRLARLYPWIEPIGYRLKIKSLPGGTMRLGSVSLTTLPMRHMSASIGLRFEEGASSVAFSGDTDYSPDLVLLAAGVDVLVAECSFPEEKVEGHLNLASLLKVVREAKPGQVIMSHLYPQWGRFHGVLPPPLLLGADGMEIDL
ncbi:MAG: ribonuclease Z [Syntrophorhabdales bacterium]|jgi:ribonuclease BN (tRNA processing enzyme)